MFRCHYSLLWNVVIWYVHGESCSTGMLIQSNREPVKKPLRRILELLWIHLRYQNQINKLIIASICKILSYQRHDVNEFILALSLERQRGRRGDNGSGFISWSDHKTISSQNQIIIREILTHRNLVSMITSVLILHISGEESEPGAAEAGSGYQSSWIEQGSSCSLMRNAILNNICCCVRLQPSEARCGVDRRVNENINVLSILDRGILLLWSC